MKTFGKILVLLLALVTAFSFAACDDGNTVDETLTGWAIEYKEHDVKKTGDETSASGKEKYITIEGLFVADGTALEVNDSDKQFKPVDLEIGMLNASGKPVIKVAVLNDDNKKIYDNKVLKTKELDLSEYDHVEISDDAFANQLIIGKVKVGSAVTKIGAAAFAGCSNITEMEVPFVGGERVGLNAAKIAGYVFGTASADGCASVKMNYNTTGSGTYYVPSGLKKIVVNAEKDADGNAYALPRYAFNNITSLKTVVLNGEVSEIGASAFSGCTGLTEFAIPASVKEIYQSAFSGCTSLLTVDFENATSLETIFQQAFSGCTKLGYGIGDRTVKFGASLKKVYEKAFYGCTAIKSVDFKACSSLTLGDAAFYNCSALATAKLPAGAKQGAFVFKNCAEGFTVA